MKKPDSKLIAVYLLAAGFVIGLAAMCSSCMTVEKAKKYLKKEDALDDVCADEFPVRDSLIKGDTVVITDTLESFEILTDTLVSKDTVFITKTLPSKTITRTIKVTDTIVRRDFAHENVLSDQLRQCNDLQIGLIDRNTELNEKYEALRKKWRGKIGIPWWVFLLIAGGLFLRFKGKIFSLLK